MNVGGRVKKLLILWFINSRSRAKREHFCQEFWGEKLKNWTEHFFFSKITVKCVSTRVKGRHIALSSLSFARIWTRNSLDAACSQKRDEIVGRFLKIWWHCGPEQPRIQTEVLGHSLVHSLVRWHRSLVRFLRTARFARAFRCARSLAHFAPSQVNY